MHCRLKIIWHIGFARHNYVTLFNTTSIPEIGIMCTQTVFMTVCTWVCVKINHLGISSQCLWSEIKLEVIQKWPCKEQQHYITTGTLDASQVLLHCVPSLVVVQHGGTPIKVGSSNALPWNLRDSCWLAVKLPNGALQIHVQDPECLLQNFVRHSPFW